jgi:hypothetical protein
MITSKLNELLSGSIYCHAYIKMCSPELWPLSAGTYKVRNEIETKRNEINKNETKRNEINEMKTK